VRRAGAAEARDQGARVGQVAAAAEREHDFPLLPIGQLDHHLHRRARVERRTDPAGKAGSVDTARTGRAAVATEDLGAIAADGALRLAGVQERHALGEIAVVRVACEQGAGLGIDLGHDVRQVRGTIRAEHQVKAAGHGKAVQCP
jgi:hypothetical protein